MMKIILSLIAVIVIIAAGCGNVSEDKTPPVYAAPSFSGFLFDSWKKTDIRTMEKLLDTKLQVPTYLPFDYEVKEVYYRQYPESSPPVTDIMLLISEQDIGWEDLRYTCRLALLIGWNDASLGLKMFWAEFIEEARGRLEITDDGYILWQASYGDPDALDSTLKLYASPDFPREELIKIAASIPAEAP